MKQPFSLLNICTFKMKSNLKHFYLQEWHQNPQLQIFIQANITVGKKLKPCQEWPHLVSGRFIKVFYKMNTCPKRPLLKAPKSDCLMQVWLYSLGQSWIHCSLYVESMESGTGLAETYIIVFRMGACKYYIYKKIKWRPT